MKSLVVQSGQTGRMRSLVASAVLIATVLATATGETIASTEERNIENLATKRVQPSYPPMAKKYRIEGKVTVQVTVSNNGKVAKAEFVRGHNIFRSVSLDAVKRWEFKPPGEAGLTGTVNFIFKLDKGGTGKVARLCQRWLFHAKNNGTDFTSLLLRGRISLPTIRAYIWLQIG